MLQASASSHLNTGHGIKCPHSSLSLSLTPFFFSHPPATPPSSAPTFLSFDWNLFPLLHLKLHLLTINRKKRRLIAWSSQGQRDSHASQQNYQADWVERRKVLCNLTLTQCLWLNEMICFYWWRLLVARLLVFASTLPSPPSQSSINVLVLTEVTSDTWLQTNVQTVNLNLLFTLSLLRG